MSSSKEKLETVSAGAIEHLLLHKPERISQITLSGEQGKLGTRLENIQALAAANDVPVLFEQRGRNKDYDPVKARLHPYQYSGLPTLIEEASQKPQSVFIALDHLKDPHNLGAIARTADGFGVDGILFPKDRSVSVTQGAYNSSVGALETIALAQVGNLGNALRELKEAGYWLVGASVSEDSQPIWTLPDFDRVAVVMGAEFEGLSPTMAKLCDVRAHIPIVGAVGSYNVSVAASIFMYEFFRKRNGSK